MGGERHSMRGGGWKEARRALPWLLLSIEGRARPPRGGDGPSSGEHQEPAARGPGVVHQDALHGTAAGGGGGGGHHARRAGAPGADLLQGRAAHAHGGRRHGHGCRQVHRQRQEDPGGCEHHEPPTHPPFPPSPPAPSIRERERGTDAASAAATGHLWGITKAHCCGLCGVGCVWVCQMDDEPEAHVALAFEGASWTSPYTFPLMLLQVTGGQ